MKTQLLFAALVAAANVSAWAQGTQLNSLGTTDPAVSRWNTSESHWDRILQQQHSVPELHLGKSDFVVSGALVESFKHRPLPEDASRGRKFLALPIISFFVPQRMSQPPGGTGRYFAWRDSSRPWIDRASGAAAGAVGNAFSPVDNEPHRSLISIGDGSH